MLAMHLAQVIQYGYMQCEAIEILFTAFANWIHVGKDTFEE